MSKKHWLYEILWNHHVLPTKEDIKNVWAKNETDVMDTATTARAILDTIESKLPKPYDWSTEPKDEWENADWVGFNRCLKAIKEALLEIGE